MLALRKYPAPVLSQKSSPAEQVDDSIRRLIDAMFRVMEQLMGQGLAAPQVGVLQRVIVMRVEGVDYAVVNPLIARARGEGKEDEGCLSIPGVRIDVPRATSLILKGLDRDGKPFKLKASGGLARVIQHELDHLDGKLIIDYLPKVERLDFDLNYIKSLQHTTR